MELEKDHQAAADKMAGAGFNPGGREDVDQMKALFADAARRVEEAFPPNDGTLANARARKIRDAALHEIITAQMWAVKAITWEQ